MLDDIWAAEHERLLKFVDQTTATKSKVFVATRFAKLLPGYVEVALGLLSEAGACELLLQTAELNARSAKPEQWAAAEFVAKMVGYPPDTWGSWVF